MLVYWATVLFAMTAINLVSSFYVAIHVIFAALRDPLLYAYRQWQAKRTGIAQRLFTMRARFQTYESCALHEISDVTPRNLFVAQWICLLPVVMYACYAISLLFDFFVPVMGRFGNVVGEMLGINFASY